MDTAPTLAQHVANSAFVAGLAYAAGDDELARRFSDSMVRAHFLSLPLVRRDAIEVVFDASRPRAARGAG